jgi:quinol-cytochrome oxidoreductase complex cytochrome b subunit/mono/diheme cytochrome c family protein
VLNRLSDWLHHRTRFRDLRDALLLEDIPGGARWRYVWGSTLVFVFTLQLLTGVLLMTAYSPGESTAWASVYFIQYQMDFGWFIRGLHHFGSQAMVVLLGLHMLQVVIAGAHLPPREINWWLGLGLLGLVLGLSLTGYLLPWDQKGLWATQVATNIAGTLPAIGPWLQKVIVGGPEYGNHTLTRFYALHVAILPPLVIVLIVAHLAVFRRHGVTAPKSAVGAGVFWPAQAFRDLVVSLMIFGVMLTFVLWGHGHAAETPPADQGLYDAIAHAGQRGLGANLDAPADLEKPYPARPEWYFLFLFQLLKYFTGEHEIIGTVAVPMAVGLLLFILPLLGIGRLRPYGHVFGVVVVLGLLTAAGTLTCLAIADDTVEPLTRAVITRIGVLVLPAIAGVLLVQLALLSLLRDGRLRKVVYYAGVSIMGLMLVATGLLLCAAVSGRDMPEPVLALVKSRMIPQELIPPQGVVTFQAERAGADLMAARAILLASRGVPEEGAKYLLRHDPWTRGPDLFREHCAGCHSFTVEGVNGFPVTAPNKASDLSGFGTARWIRGLLHDPGDPHYFGNTKLSGMRKWAKSVQAKQAEMSAAQKAEQEHQYDLIAQWLGTHPHARPQETTGDLAEGYKAFSQKRGGCISCHGFAGSGGESAPDLTGYGSAEWIRLMVMSPNHPKRYPATNEMPAFRSDAGPGAELQLQEFREANPNVPVNPLNDLDRELIIRWLVGDS